MLGSPVTSMSIGGFEMGCFCKLVLSKCFKVQNGFRAKTKPKFINLIGGFFEGAELAHGVLLHTGVLHLVSSLD